MTNKKQLNKEESELDYFLKPYECYGYDCDNQIEERGYCKECEEAINMIQTSEKITNEK